MLGVGKMMQSPTLVPEAKLAYEEGAGGWTAAQLRCTHHWIIGRATASVSGGICRFCGAQKQFPNYLSSCLANPDKESYQEWLKRQEWQEVTWTQEDVVSGFEGGKSLPSRLQHSPSRRGKGRGGTRKGSMT